MDTEDDAPVYPLIGYNLAVVDGAVVIRLEYATTRAEYTARSGQTQQIVMSPEHAAEFAKDVIECGAMAERPAGVRPS